MSKNTMNKRAEFIHTSILLIGVGVFHETETGYFYFNGLDMLWASKDLECWWANGEYIESPVAWALATC